MHVLNILRSICEAGKWPSFFEQRNEQQKSLVGHTLGGMHWLAKLLVGLKNDTSFSTILPNVQQKTATIFESLKSFKILPLQDGSFASVHDGIYMSLATKNITPKFLSALSVFRSELFILHDGFLASVPEESSDCAIFNHVIQRQFGLAQMDMQSVVVNHILPTLKKPRATWNSHIVNDFDRVVAYLRCIKEYLRSLTTQASIDSFLEVLGSLGKQIPLPIRKVKQVKGSALENNAHGWQENAQLSTPTDEIHFPASCGNKHDWLNMKSKLLEETSAIKFRFDLARRLNWVIAQSIYVYLPFFLIML